MDKILIEGLQVKARVGVTAVERRKPQAVFIDLELEADLAGAARRDAVEETVDYAAVVREVKALVKERSFRLVEAMAQATAESVSSRFRPDQVRVRIRKFSVPGTASVGVEITRGRSRTTSGFPRTGLRSPETLGSSRSRKPSEPVLQP